MMLGRAAEFFQSEGGEAYQPEDDGDRPGIGIGVLDGECVDDVLMNECGVAKFERVKR